MTLDELLMQYRLIEGNHKISEFERALKFWEYMKEIFKDDC